MLHSKCEIEFSIFSAILFFFLNVDLTQTNQEQTTISHFHIPKYNVPIEVLVINAVSGILLKAGASISYHLGDVSRVYYGGNEMSASTTRGHHSARCAQSTPAGGEEIAQLVKALGS